MSYTYYTESITGAQGPQGPEGPQGSAGNSVTILGSYADLAAFEAGAGSVPGVNPGDAWILLSDGSLMSWNGTAWFDAGDIRGPEGPQGPQGIQGETGPTGDTGAPGIPGTPGADFAALYGAWQDTTTQNNPTPGSANLMTFNTVDFENGINLNLATNTMVFPTPGLYNIQWSGQFAKSGNDNADIFIWANFNGTPTIGSTGVVTIQNRGISGWNYFVQTTVANETAQIVWSSTEASMQLKSYPANGTHPSTASVIVTVTQVA